MSRFITPNPKALMVAATIKAGWRIRYDTAFPSLLGWQFRLRQSGIHAVITSDDRSCIQQPEIFVCYRVSLPGHLALSSRQDPNIRAIG